MDYHNQVTFLTMFTTVFTLLGIAGAHDTGCNSVTAARGGVLAGLFFGLVVGGGIKGRLLCAAYSPSDARGGNDL